MLVSDGLLSGVWSGVWWVSGKTKQNDQTDGQTPTRHLPKNASNNSNIKVSGLVSGGVWSTPKCHCLSGGVSLGRARPDTQTASSQTSENQEAKP